MLKIEYLRKQTKETFENTLNEVVVDKKRQFTERVSTVPKNILAVFLFEIESCANIKLSLRFHFLSHTPFLFQETLP